MPKFLCSYAHDLPCYRDFVIEAKSERAAVRVINKALREGKFSNVNAVPWWENGPSNERVFVQGVAGEQAPSTTFGELTGDEHRFNPNTRLCIHCNRHADDDAQEHLPCHP